MYYLQYVFDISAQQYVLFTICVFSISVHQYVLIQYLCVICTIYNMYLTFLSSNIYLCYYPRFNSKYYSIKKILLIQFKRQFNLIVRESLILVKQEKCPKIGQLVSKIDKKGGFSSKTANIDSKYDSFFHFSIKFNSNDYSISIFSGIFNAKNY